MYGKLLTGLFFKRRNLYANWENGKLVPTVVELIEKMQLCCGNFRVNGAVIDRLYEVTAISNVVFQVDVVNKTCNCLQWHLRGFTCQHDVYVLKGMRVDWADYCSKFYFVDAYKATYGPEIQLLIGREDWNRPHVVINPPIDMRKPGRPTRKRKKAFDEVYTERKQRTC
ncbi:hypothetical protein MKX01_002515 [Papaver californicum]|nr:hypothetical protein MKX01_002515 [Papaver californicum]